MQIFQGQAKRLDLTLLEQEVLERVKRPLPARRGIEGEPLGIFNRYVQQRQKGREAGLKCPVQRQNLARDFLSNLARLVARLDLEVALEEVDHRQEHVGLAIGGSAPFEDEPAVSPMGVNELPEQPRLAHARLTHERDDLAATGPGFVEGPVESLQFSVATHELAQPPRRSYFHARAHRSRTGHLEDLEWNVEPLDLHGTQRLDLNIAFGHRQSVGGDEYRSGHRHLFHPRGHVRRLADDRIVHPEVAPDRAHDDFAGIESHPDLDRDALDSTNGLGVAFHGLLHAERGVARADRGVFVRNRRPEQRHDSVAENVIDGAFEAVNRFHHMFDDGVE